MTFECVLWTHSCLELADEVVSLEQFVSDVLECVTFRNLVQFENIERPVVYALQSQHFIHSSNFHLFSTQKSKAAEIAKRNRVDGWQRSCDHLSGMSFKCSWQLIGSQGRGLSFFKMHLAISKHEPRGKIICSNKLTQRGQEGKISTQIICLLYI